MDKKTFKIIHPGLHTSFQDLGRQGMECYGISAGGAMDPILAQIVNNKLRNPPSHPVLEFYLMPPKIKILHQCSIALAGVQAHFIIDNVDKGQIAFVNQGQIISIKMTKGSYGYLSLGGQMSALYQFDSYSHHQLANIGSPKLKKGQIIGANLSSTPMTTTLSSIRPKIYSSSIKVRKGPEFHLLNQKQQTSLLNQNYTVTQSANRMAIPLHIEKPVTHKIKIVSSPVLPGTVQLPPDGQPILLGRDCQTIGGYPRVLILELNSLIDAFQTPPGHSFKIYMEE